MSKAIDRKYVMLIPKGKKRNTIVNYAKELEESGKIPLDQISMHIVDVLREYVNKDYVRECLGKKYKVRYRAENVNKRYSGRMENHSKSIPKSAVAKQTIRELREEDRELIQEEKENGKQIINNFDWYNISKWISHVYYFPIKKDEIRIMLNKAIHPCRVCRKDAIIHETRIKSGGNYLVNVKHLDGNIKEEHTWIEYESNKRRVVEEYEPNHIPELESKGIELTVCLRCKKVGYSLRSIERYDTDEKGFFKIRYRHPKGEIIQRDTHTNEIIKRIPFEEETHTVGTAIGMDRAFGTAIGMDRAFNQSLKRVGKK